MRMEDSCNFFISSDINRLFTSKLAASEASIWHVVRKIGGLQPTSDFYYVNIEIELPNKILGYLPEPSIRSLTCPTEIDEYTKDICADFVLVIENFSHRIRILHNRLMNKLTSISEAMPGHAHRRQKRAIPWLLARFFTASFKAINNILQYKRISNIEKDTLNLQGIS